LKNLTEREAAIYQNKHIGFVFQSFNLIEYKNALENVALPLYYQKTGEKERNKIALSYLEQLGLKEWWHHKPSELSGGQKQRVAIARTLITNPKLILADEPTRALSQYSRDIMEVLREINKTKRITMIIVTHDNEIAKLTDRTIFIKDGVIQTGNRSKYSPDLLKIEY
jgi:putative ABC transport system ATP-binding protein